MYRITVLVSIFKKASTRTARQALSDIFTERIELLKEAMNFKFADLTQAKREEAWEEALNRITD